MQDTYGNEISVLQDEDAFTFVRTVDSLQIGYPLAMGKEEAVRRAINSFNAQCPSTDVSENQ